MKKYAHSLLVGLILLWTLGLGLYLAHFDSMTTDEGIHVSSAYLALTRHEFRFDPEHPYLFKALSALPLLPLHLNPPPHDQKLWEASHSLYYDSWEEARAWTEEWFYRSGNNADLMIFLMRLPAVLTLVGLCALVYFVCRRWFNKTVALYALIFTAFNPTVVAHGHLANTDLPATFGYLATLFMAWWYSQKPSWSRAVLLGLVCGLSQITKFSAILLLPMLTLWFVYLFFTRRRPSIWIGHFLCVLFLIWVVIWLGYGWPLLHLNSNRDTSVINPLFQGYLIQHHINLDSITQIVRYFLPLDYAKGLLMVVISSVYGRGTFLLGVNYPSGTWLWQYFPLLYLFKTQLIALILLLGGLFATLKGFRWSKLTPLAVLLWGCGLIYTYFSIKNKLDIGIRHILPLLVLLSIALAVITYQFTTAFKKAWLPPLLMGLYILPFLFFLQNLIGFTNVLVQPPSRAYAYFSDSNIDWGQQARQIAEVVTTHFPGKKAYLNYRWSPYSVEYYGLKTYGYDPRNLPHDGVIILTANNFTFPEYDSFKNRPPDYQIANHTFFYDLRSLSH